MHTHMVCVQLHNKCLRERHGVNQTSEDLLTNYCNGYRLGDQFTELLSTITRGVS